MTTEKPELQKVWKCSTCDQVIDDPVTLYECGNDSTIFTREESPNSNHQCPECNKFSSKLTANGCPDCKEELEEVEMIFDDETSEWVTEEDWNAEHPEDDEEEEEEDDVAVYETSSTGEVHKLTALPDDLEDEFDENAAANELMGGNDDTIYLDDLDLTPMANSETILERSDRIVMVDPELERAINEMLDAPDERSTEAILAKATVLLDGAAERLEAGLQETRRLFHPNDGIDPEFEFPIVGHYAIGNQKSWEGCKGVIQQMDTQWTWIRLTSAPSKFTSQIGKVYRTRTKNVRILNARA